jgi:hypothetical protein
MFVGSPDRYNWDIWLHVIISTEGLVPPSYLQYHIVVGRKGHKGTHTVFERRKSRNHYKNKGTSPTWSPSVSDSGITPSIDEAITLLLLGAKEAILPEVCFREGNASFFCIPKGWIWHLRLVSCLLFSNQGGNNSIKRVTCNRKLLKNQVTLWRRLLPVLRGYSFW